MVDCVNPDCDNDIDITSEAKEYIIESDKPVRQDFLKVVCGKCSKVGEYSIVAAVERVKK